ncbi:uncharacterized protein FTJAE_1553 [Fusarium tjaetaba]|uniref:WW domain-containing protein n=1 Tax=Fusarium tjaetaba TaxID=1567544 RepID=A0A8H5W774_9HYPO|nr:uncharacterized protein FTJAE_1553 [Fusarium tjaetaba]KAF5647870.1 hypothetical protein FTJAE_1553 [Fusarium tjaetaba]
MATGDSIFFAAALLCDPTEGALPCEVRRVWGSIGKPGMAMMIPPKQPQIRDTRQDWSVVTHNALNEKLEDAFQSTTVHLLFTDYVLPIDVGTHGNRDFEPLNPNIILTLALNPETDRVPYMSAHTSPVAEEALGGDGSPLPAGWMAKWSPSHKAWYYVFFATGATQWERPLFQPEQQQYQTIQDQDPNVPTIENHPTTTEVMADNQVVGDGDRGLGKTTLAIGGGLLAGYSLRNKFEKHHESHGQQNGLGKMAQSAAIAGAGAVGAKIMGLFGNKQQQQQPPAPPVQVATQTQMHFYPVYVPGPQVSPPQLNHGQPSPSSSSYTHSHTAETVGAAPGIQSFGAPHQVGTALMSLQSTTSVGAFQPQSGPLLHIHGAVFVDKDVTQIVRSLVTQQQTLQTKGDSLIEQFGDPWPEVERKMFNVLYSYGDRPMELLAADTTSSNIEINHEALSKKRMEFCQAPPSPIIAVVWGYENVLTRSRMEQLEKTGELDGGGDTLGADKKVLDYSYTNCVKSVLWISNSSEYCPKVIRILNQFKGTIIRAKEIELSVQLEQCIRCS